MNAIPYIFYLPNTAKNTIFPSIDSFLTLNKSHNKNIPYIFIFTSYGCDACKRIYPFLNELIKEHPYIQFRLITLANEDQANELIEQFNLNDIPLTMIKHEHIHKFGITGFPFAYLVSEKSVILDKGLVNHKEDFRLLMKKIKRAKIA
ncbi:TlpA family protein disulfide reductase [Pontibacillus yanchengensis]|uniref:TlpA family protein disulfide reductase n=1 Tax=Pontibacillus yanchengensis TaxID=462910 RepID=UPI00136E38FA|nr:hypothetical protein [Pontibacillus yanchengensis]